MTDTPTRLELSIGDRDERARVSATLIGEEGPLRDRALLFEEPPPVSTTPTRVPASVEDVAAETLWQIRRRMIRDDLRSGALPLLAGSLAFSLATVGLASLGIAYVRGRYAVTLRPVGVPAPLSDEGDFLEIWRKEPDHAWRIIEAMWNTRLQPPG